VCFRLRYNVIGIGRKVNLKYVKSKIDIKKELSCTEADTVYEKGLITCLYTLPRFILVVFLALIIYRRLYQTPTHCYACRP
jgi:hypothetical protein